MEGFVWCPHCGSPHSLGTPSCPKTGQPLVRGHVAERGLQRGSFIAKRYKVRSWIGQENVAFLYDATNIGLARRVLVKYVHGEDVPLAEREEELVEMEREARASSMVEHPNVGEVLDFGRLARGEGFLVRHWSSRARLAASLRAAGALDVGDAGDLLSQILSGLHVLHRAGILHRDLGPHCITLVERQGCRPHAIVHGLGRVSGPGIDPPRGLPPGIHYASPELLRGGKIDEASDLFSCGVMLFEMITGRRPFEAAKEEEVQLAILRDQRPSAAKLNARLDRAWLEVLDKALHPDPRRRFRSAIDFMRALPTHVRPATRLRSVEDSEAETDMVNLADLSPSSSVASRPPSSRRGSRCDTYIGRKLANKYRIESLLGSGSAGAVYKATHVDLRRPVAVKVLHDWNRTSEQFVERFKSEALAASKLDHPNVTRVLDCGREPDGTLYLVMEFVEGKSLDAVIAEEGRLPAERAVNITVQLVSALAYAHDAGIIHRDIKPENIILLREHDEEGTRDLAKVCDFGLAKASARDMDEDAPELTRAGLLLGSPAYMSPEQIRGEATDTRTDIYCAGVTLFEMLTGRLPHEADAMDELFRKKLGEPPCRPSTVVPDEIDPLLEDIVLHALEPSPAMRHASARQMLTELAEVLTFLRAPPSANEVTVSVWPSEMPGAGDAES